MQDGFGGLGWPLGPRQMLRLAGALAFVWGRDGLRVMGPEGPLSPGETGTLARALEPVLREEIRGKSSVEAQVRLEKPVRGGTWYQCAGLRRSDGRLAGLLRDTTAEQMERQRLLEQSHRDWLTGLWNRQGMSQRVEDTLAEEGRATLLMVDMDNFKEVNDSRGHLEGDRVLVGITQTVAGSIREDDLVGRPGGDEFLIFLPGVGAREALDKRCAVIRERVRELRLLDGNCVTVSMGAALVRPGETYDELYARADKALYQAKEKGRDCFVVADEDPPVSE